MYSVYFHGLGRILLPVTPSKIDYKINGRNKTMTLLNGSEINEIKTTGLTDISFTFLLPNQKYSFASYLGGKYRPANYFLDKIEEFKKSTKPFLFFITRKTQNENDMFGTSMYVTIEDYSIEEDVKNGFDIEVSIKLKQFIEYGTKVIPNISNSSSSALSKTSTRISNKKIPSTYTVKSGDSLWSISKKLLGNGAKCWNLAKLNGISNPNKIYVGQILKIKDVKASAAPINSSKSKSSGVSASNSSVSSDSYSYGYAALGGMSLLIEQVEDKKSKSLTGSTGYSDSSMVVSGDFLNKA